MKVNLESALKMISAAEKKAVEINVPMVIAVVDQGGALVAQHRMDGALLASIDIALNKAYTGAATKLATSDLAGLSQPGQPLYGINTCDRGRIVILGGGYPIKDGGEVIGGLGVSGGSVEDDMTCALAGLSAFGD